MSNLSQSVRDLAELASFFTRHRVPYCAVGGFATACYVDNREPRDLDLIIGTTMRAGRRASRAIATLEQQHCPTAGTQATRSFMDPALLADGAPVVLQTRLGQLHLVGTHLPTTTNRDAFIHRRRWFAIDGHNIAVTAIDDLIGLKQLVARPTDLNDLTLLKAKTANSPK